KILGGLGNQMFQYAAAKALANKNDTEVKVDISAFTNYQLRSYDLDKLNVPLSVASPKEIENLKATNSLQRIVQRIIPYSARKFYKEPYFHHDKNFERLGKDVYVQGYFQSQKYFISSEDEIRKQFTLKAAVSKEIKEYGAALQSHHSVAIHIRNGDYKSAEMLNVHGILPLSYYEQAIRFIRGKLPKAKFYVFSDDANVAQGNFLFNSFEIVSGNVSQNHFEDLFLMSSCRHNIIANSSFSWWAAWLNDNPDKVVIGPKKWFNHGPKDTQDILPEGWIKL
ncbi:MAG TPA: alpha-1,2-fucosyltransferase, partial [Flavisolibacter sp.]|nr:alpha-1,2-fucosyltransferase [Flavisolibacter sp.]